jgi:hypothetical protein
MPYLCFINPRAGEVAHFQVLPAYNRSGAVHHAARLLREHDDADTADLWRGEDLVLRISRAEANRIVAASS